MLYIWLVRQETLLPHVVYSGHTIGFLNRLIESNVRPVIWGLISGLIGGGPRGKYAAEGVIGSGPRGKYVADGEI